MTVRAGLELETPSPMIGEGVFVSDAVRSASRLVGAQAERQLADGLGGRVAPALRQGPFLVAVVLTGDLHAAEIPVEASVRSLALKHDCCVTPELGVRDALNAFEDNECDVLAVIDSPAARRVVGLLTEAHALRRYGEELERRHRAVIER